MCSRKFKILFRIGKFELSEYSPLTVLKNDTAEKLRSISVKFTIKMLILRLARLFLDQSSKLAVSEAILDKIESDKKQLKENEAMAVSFRKIRHVKI